MVGLTRGLRRQLSRISFRAVRRGAWALHARWRLDPKLLIADEPTAGLDMSVQAEVLNLLNEMQARTGVAILVITHNLNVVRHITDRMAIMYLGRFVGTGADRGRFQCIRATPIPRRCCPRTQSPIPDAREKRVKLLGEVPSPVNRPSGCEFHPRCPHARPDCSEIVPEWQGVDARGFSCRYPL